ncbi:MAG: malate dehydrogenase, partial [Methylophilaceae bacterium]|nr:malate dehydrogenase [Methylophilaceae bacterium]
GALAGKPVMEGKAVLFKRLAGIDVFDIEINAPSVEAFIETVINIAPTFGGINLEDIAAPHCFVIEKALRERLNIPVFHDDQHGTAVVVAAGLLNALMLQEKALSEARIVFLGAGAAGCACARLLKIMGAQHITMVDRNGVLDTSRPDLHDNNRLLAITSGAVKTLSDAMHDADVLVGVSAAGAVPPALIKQMAARPIIFALANPDPEITPADVLAMREDVLMATGRSDYPNQVNNAMCFPYLFRGALDARAPQISDAMQIAAAHTLASLAREPVPSEVLVAYQLDSLQFGKDYILPKPLDTRLREVVSAAVREAALREAAT